MAEKEDRRQGVGKHDQGKFHGDVEEELDQAEPVEPDEMVPPVSADEAGSEAGSRRPHHTTTADQREYGGNLPEETEGMAIKEDAAPGADSQGS